MDIIPGASREHGQSPDSQETISDNNLASEIDEKEVSKTFIPMNYKHQKVFLEIRISQTQIVIWNQASQIDFVLILSISAVLQGMIIIHRQKRRENHRERFQFLTTLVELRRIWNGRTNVIYVPNLFQWLQFQKIL